MAWIMRRAAPLFNIGGVLTGGYPITSGRYCLSSPDGATVGIPAGSPGRTSGASRIHDT
jgi:hypothetical protein